MKYSKKFEETYNWYLSVTDKFNFDGTKDYYTKNGKEIIVFSKEGKSAKECFYLYDSQGIIEPTCEPAQLELLLKTKGSVNLHIKMYAEDRAKGVLSFVDFVEICEEVNAPMWFFKAVQEQRVKYMTPIVKRLYKEAKTKFKLTLMTKEEIDANRVSAYKYAL